MKNLNSYPKISIKSHGYRVTVSSTIFCQPIIKVLLRFSGDLILGEDFNCYYNNYTSYFTPKANEFIELLLTNTYRVFDFYIVPTKNNFKTCKKISINIINDSRTFFVENSNTIVNVPKSSQLLITELTTLETTPSFFNPPNQDIILPPINVS